MVYRDNGARWNAVQRRDPAADGLFVYAVRTTRIYCRPVCTARLARRGNVEFFDQPGDAESAGYRSCKRCKPQGVAMPEPAAATRVKAVIEKETQYRALHRINNESEAVTKSTSRLAKEANVSKWHFHRLFKALTGLTPTEYFARQQATDPESSNSTVVHVHQPTISTALEDCLEPNAYFEQLSLPDKNQFEAFVNPDGSLLRDKNDNLYNNMVDWPSLCNLSSFDLAWQGGDLGTVDISIDEDWMNACPLDLSDPIGNTMQNMPMDLLGPTSAL